MGASCNRQRPATGGNRGAAAPDAVGADMAADQQQSQVLKATAGGLLASARIRRGDINQFYSFENQILGTGFSGPVKLAVDTTTGRKYAVKPFNKIGADKDKVNMLRNEAQIYLRLDHPHIARLIEVWENEHHVYIVMECCSGGELYERLCAKKVYSEDAARRVAAQMASAIQYLHSHDIVHRDLKLENWLYQSPDEMANLKLIDFGFSKIWNTSSKRMQATCGTLVYVSPDTLLGGYTNACDMWSVGVIVYMLLVGYPPFFGTEEEMFEKILAADYSVLGPRWRKVSAAAKDFVMRLLTKDPNKRLTALEAVQHPWLSAAETIPPPVLDSAVVESLRNYAKSSRFQRAALTLIASSLTSDQIEGMREIFLGIDKSKEGTIRLTELAEVLESNPEISKQEVEKIFRTLDTSGDQQVYYNDFLAAMLTCRLTIDEDLLRASFIKFDVDRSGFISFDNIRHVLGDFYTDAALMSMFTEADKDGNGLIDYEEFIRLVKYREERGDHVSKTGGGAILKSRKKKSKDLRTPEKAQLPSTNVGVGSQGRETNFIVTAQHSDVGRKSSLGGGSNEAAAVTTAVAGRTAAAPAANPED